MIGYATNINDSVEKCNIKYSSFKVIGNDKIHLIIHTLLYILLALSSLYESTLFATAVSVATVIYFLFSKPNEHFFFLIGFVPFEYVARIEGINSYFLFLLISILKLSISKRNRKYRFGGIISLFLLVVIEIIQELGSATNGELLMVLTIIAYFCTFILYSDETSYNMTRIVKNFSLSYIVVIVHAISSYGSFRTFLQMAATNSEIIRFADKEDSLGGAMGLPLYSALVISMLVSYYIVKRKLNIKVKMLMIFICVCAFLFGILTISRSFILCTSIWLILLVVSVSNKQRKKIFKVLFIAIIISVIVYSQNKDSIIEIINKFLYRASADSGMGIRGRIWESCFEYLKNNPLGYFVGFGIMKYVKIGMMDGTLFSYMAHNLYIDVIMSIGTIGMLVIIYLLTILKSKVKNVFQTKLRLITAIPLIVFLTFGFTALSLNNFKTWIYIIMLVIYAHAIPIDNVTVKGEIVDV